MPIQQNLDVQLSVYSCAPKNGQVLAISYDKKERLGRAIKFGSLTWLAAAACIFVPVLHFVLVPTGLILGPIVFLKFLNQKDQILSGTGTCPKCQSLLSIDSQNLDWPIQQSCVSCNALVVAEVP